MESSSSLRPTPGTIALISVGTLLFGTVAYAAYFDHRRRTDPAFRKALKREQKALAKQQKVAAESAARDQQRVIRALVEKMNEEGYPTDDKEQEAFFLKHLATAEQRQASTDPDEMMEAACSFFKALKVYPRKSELISIIDSQVKKDVLDILAVMISFDETIASDISGL